MRTSAGVKEAFFAVALIFPLLSSCGGSAGDVTTGSVSSTGTRISLYWPDGYSYDEADGAITTPSGQLNATLPAYVTGMTLTISGEGIDPPVVLNVPLDTLTVNFAITPGIRTFTILVNTSIPGLSFTASQTLDLVAGAQVKLDFNLVINAPPVVDSVSVSNSAPQTGAAISVSCVASDPDGNPISYSWSYKGGKGSFSGSGATVSFKATSGGSITITCTASDGKGGEGKGAVTIVANAPPVVKSVTASDTSPKVGDTITLTCNASDPDGDRLTYKWSDGGGGGTFSGNSSQVTYEVASKGSKTFTCTVSDGRGGTDTGSVTIAAVPAVYSVSFSDELLASSEDDWDLGNVGGGGKVSLKCSLVDDNGTYTFTVNIQVYKDSQLSNLLIETGSFTVLQSPKTLEFNSAQNTYYLRFYESVGGVGSYSCTAKYEGQQPTVQQTQDNVG